MSHQAAIIFYLFKKMQLKTFQIHFSQYSYEEMYEEPDKNIIYNSEDKQQSIYKVKQRGQSQNNFIAKKYIYQKIKFPEYIWDEVNSVVKIINHNHPNIIKYQDIFLFDYKEQNNVEFQVCIMIMQQEGGNSLENQLQEVTKQFQKKVQKNKKQSQDEKKYENQLYLYLKQTLNGCKFLTSQNIYLRDYNPMSLVLDNDVVKIKDLNKIKSIQMDNIQQMSGEQGSGNYSDPNLLKIQDLLQKEEDKGNTEVNYSLEKLDVYQIGSIFLKLAKKWNHIQYGIYVIQTQQFYQYQQFQNQEIHLQKEIQSIQHQKLKLLLSNMLVLDLEKRWNLEECLQEQKLLQPVEQVQKQKQENLVQEQEYQQQQVQQQQKSQQQQSEQNLENEAQKQQKEKDSQQQQEQQIEMQQQDQQNEKIILTQQQIKELDRIKYTLEISKNNDLYGDFAPGMQNLQILGDKINLNQAMKLSSIIYKQQYFLFKLSIKIQEIKQNDLQLILLSIRNCNNLIILNLEIGSCIGVEGALNIQEVFQQLTTLQQIQLNIGQKSQIGVKGAQSIAEGLEKQTNLEELGLTLQRENFIGMDGIQSIGSVMAKLITIQKLKLHIGSQNKIRLYGAQSFAQALSKLSSLKYLQFIIDEKNYIGKEGGEIILQEIQKKNQLQKLKLKIITEEDNGLGQNIGQTLGKLTQLKSLKFETCTKNNISAEGIKSIGSALTDLQNLENLGLQFYDQPINQEGALNIGQGLQSLKLLQKLDLVFDKGQIQEKGAQSIGKAIGKLTSLKKLKLNIGYDNNIYVKGAQSIGEGLGKLINLEKLEFYLGEKNNIKVEGAQSIGEGLSKLKKLQSLELEFHRENLAGLKYIYIQIEQLPSLCYQKVNLTGDK